MQAEWLAECGADDPVLVVPWGDADSGLAYVDLRTDPDAIDLLAEAELYPALAQALRSLNASRSAVFTAKCDAWPMDGEEVEAVRLELGLDLLEEEDDQVELSDGFASYIDLLCRERSLFASFPRQETLLQRLVRLTGPLEHPHAALECVLRPAVLQEEMALQGYAISLYVKAVGTTQAAAVAAWSGALADVVTLLRGNVFR